MSNGSGKNSGNHDPAGGLHDLTGDATSPERARSSEACPCVVVVDGDAALRSSVCRALANHCQTHPVEPGAAVATLRRLSIVDVALIDCDAPPSAQAPIFRELARWPGVVCVLMSANVQKVEQLRALGVFAPLVLDKPLQPEALDAICSATLELRSVMA